MALVLVLGVMAVITLIALTFTRATTTRVQVARGIVDQAKAEALADAGAARAIALLEAEPAGAGGASLRSFAFELGEGRVEVVLRNEGGLVDLNAASLELIRWLLLVLGLAPDEARQMAERIGDFRDPVHARPAQGAEVEDYAAAGMAQGALDGPLRDESDLLGVLGMSGELYRRLRPHVTVFSGTDTVDPTAATREVLLAVPGLGAPGAALWLAAQRHPGALEPPVPDTAWSYLQPGLGLAWRIQARATLRNGATFLREAVVSVDGPASYSIRAWRMGPE
jgi:general secretion pathway protein K